MQIQKNLINVLERHLGRSKKSGRGWQRAFVCPKCKHGLNLEINLDNPRKPLLHCWYCELKPRTLQALAKNYMGSDALREINEVLSTLPGFESLVDASPKSEVILPLELPKDYGFVFSGESISARNAMYYLRSRDIDFRVIRELYLGVSEEYPGRVIIPSFDRDFKLNFFTARSVDGSNPKYKNPERSKDIVFNERLLDFSRPLVIVEGPFDMMKVRGVYPNTTCLLGSALSTKSALFQRIVEAKTPVVLSLDNNAKRTAASIVHHLLLR